MAAGPAGVVLTRGGAKLGCAPAGRQAAGPDQGPDWMLVSPAFAQDAAAAGAAGKVAGKRGVFYNVVGGNVRAIDGPTTYSTFPANVSAKLPPAEPDRVAAEVSAMIRAADIPAWAKASPVPRTAASMAAAMPPARRAFDMFPPGSGPRGPLVVGERVPVVSRGSRRPRGRRPW